MALLMSPVPAELPDMRTILRTPARAIRSRSSGMLL